MTKTAAEKTKALNNLLRRMLFLRLDINSPMIAPVMQEWGAQALQHLTSGQIEALDNLLKPYKTAEEAAAAQSNAPDLTKAIAHVEIELHRCGLKKNSFAVNHWLESMGYVTWENMDIDGYRLLYKLLKRSV
jgi:hypothetical protein